MMVKTLLPVEDKPEVSAIIAFLQTLSDARRREFYSFMGGAMFMANAVGQTTDKEAVERSSA